MTARTRALAYIRVVNRRAAHHLRRSCASSATPA
jgi:hypothetical protein